VEARPAKYFGAHTSETCHSSIHELPWLWVSYLQQAHYPLGVCRGQIGEAPEPLTRLCAEANNPDRQLLLEAPPVVHQVKPAHKVISLEQSMQDRLTHSVGNLTAGPSGVAQQALQNRM
jgi:hypothetical protein